MQTPQAAEYLIMPAHLELVSRSPFRFVLLPRESSIEAIIRGIFEALGASLLLLNRYFGVPCSGLGMAICDVCRPLPHYKIGGPKVQLTAYKVHSELRQLANNRFLFESIQISQATHLSPLTLPEEAVIRSLCHLMPGKLILNNVQLNIERMQAGLENDKQYYKVESLESPVPTYTFTRQEKLPVLVLPSHPESMVHELQSYAARRLKVRHLYFTAPVPERYEQRVAELLQIVAPTLQSLTVNEANMPTDELARQIRAI